MAKSIPPLDLMFLLTENANSPKHVGGVLVFDLPEGKGRELVDKIVAKYRNAAPIAPFNYLPELLNIGMPKWKIAAGINPHYHVQHLALPPGATESDFNKLIEDLHEPALDRNRPLFRVWLIEGLNGGRSFAIYAKIHHAIIDGASAIMRITQSLATAPSSSIGDPFYAVAMGERKPRPPKPLLEQLASLNATARRQSTALRELSLEVMKKGLSRLRLTAGRGSLPFIAPDTPLNAPVRPARGFAALSLPLADMRAVSKAFDATINDLAVTIVDAGVHRYLEAIGHPSKRPLVAMCPVSLREAGDQDATTKVSAIFAPLGAPHSSIGDRMGRVMAAINDAKDDVKAMSKDAALMYAISAFGLGEVADKSSLGRYSGHLANFILSNVPGSRDQLYVGSARLTGIYPVSTMAAGIGLNVTLISTGDVMGFGIVANGQSLPDIDRLAHFTREAFDEIKALSLGQAKKPAKAAPKGRKRAAPRKMAAAAR